RWPEPLGLVVHEGMSRGRAVIGTRPGGHADLIVDGESGLLVPSGDAVALAAAIARLLADPALRARLGTSGRQLVLREFDLRQNVRDLVDRIGKVAAARTDRRPAGGG
ncbi:MAG TPA: glycosyltransferase, partial [Candidatus Limnocylindrales bacterium]